MIELKKIKLNIILIWFAIFLVILMGLFGLLEKKKIIDHYIFVSEGLISITLDHFRQDKIDVTFEGSNKENINGKLRHIYKFSENGFYIVDMMLIDTKGQVIKSFSSDRKKIKSVESEKFIDFKKDKTVVFYPNIGSLYSILFSDSKRSIFTFSPIIKENTVIGYIGYEYYATNEETFYFIYDQIIIFLLLLLILVLMIYLFKYIRTHNIAEEKIYHRQLMLSKMFENASDGIMVVDENRRVKSINKAMETMLGKSLNDLEKGISCKSLVNCTSNDGGSISPLECPFLCHSKDNNVFEFNISNVFGELLHVSATVSTIMDEVTGERETIFLIRDETKRKKEELQMELLEEFEKVIPYDMEKMSDFIVEKVTEVTNSDRVLIYEGNTYDSINLLNISSLKRDDNQIYIPPNECLIARTYISRKIEIMDEVEHPLRKMFNAEYFICCPLIVNNQMTGVLLLIYNQVNHEVQNTIRKLKRVSTDIAALLKVYRTMSKTNEQKLINEQLYKFNLSLQQKIGDKDVSVDTLDKIKKITKSDYIVFRSNTNPHLSGKSGVGSIKENNEYDEPGDIIDYTLKWGRSFSTSITNKDLPEEFSNFCLINNENLQTIYSIPLILNNKVLGGLLIGFRREFYIGEEWEGIVRTIGQMLSIYLENMQLHEQIENSATILERKRISREIHDGIAQNIGFINIELSRLKKMLEKQEYERVIHEISIVKEAVDESYTDLRETLDQLGDKDSYTKNIVEWINLYLQDFEITHRIKTEFKCEINDVILTDNQQVQLTRVIQEVLNNIRKHAKASLVKVRISQDNNDLNIFISDNGVGFEPTLVEKKKYSGNGLFILKERIMAINGKIKIHSIPNEGTTIEIGIKQAS